ncbi:hypothetical protein NE237_019585 [Protea cynaroides]|uniref:Uncharacterized protein n=1 Tax=Protea cynaroides TaxID=273540 RepID=A0A9Q0K2N1_9MAGN|nr:hypothetical protein NE237_019585 [Protea cynaroides]
MKVKTKQKAPTADKQLGGAQLPPIEPPGKQLDTSHFLDYRSLGHPVASNFEQLLQQDGLDIRCFLKNFKIEVAHSSLFIFIFGKLCLFNKAPCFALVHLGISTIEERLEECFQHRYTGKVQGIPKKTLADDKTTLEEYFQDRYLGKFIGNFQETCGMRTGWGAVLLAEAIALIAASTVHRVCITTCFLFSVGLLYEINKISGVMLSKTEGRTKRH